jgi:hypothetical protein
VTGRSVAGDVPVRDPAHRLSRARALDVYTNGSAWFSFEEDERGRLAPGNVADVAILAEDYFEVEDEGAALLGQDAVWVEHGSRRRLRAHMHALFESVEPLAPVTILLGGRPVTRYLLFRCRGFRGVPGLTPGVPEFDEH